MDSFEWNKIAGAVLFALLLSVGLSIFSHVLFQTEAPETPGYIVAVATEEGAPAGAEAGAPSAGQPIGVLLANADPDAGAASAKKCGACHTFAQGEANKVGPNLWGVVNRPIASHEGYEYDDAMRAFAEQAGTWTFEHLNTFLTDPKATVPGTKMAFAGLKSDSERANVIAYLRTLSDSPAPLPEAAAAEAETQVASIEPEAPAAGAETAAEAPAATVEEAPAAAEQAVAAAPAEEPAAAAAPEPAPAAAPAEQTVAQAEAPAEAGAAAAGDAAKGETFAKRCAACHNFEAGGPNGVGPNLHGVVGRPIASAPDFAYSDAMKAYSEGGAKVWDEATLATYLADPKGTVPGNKMAFPGVKKDTDRANVIAYLKTLSQ